MNERFYPALLIAGGGGGYGYTKQLTIADTHANTAGPAGRKDEAI
mgnify:CR=1 FL=1